MKTALIAGASGLVGKSLLYTLLEQQNYTRITVLVRKPLAIKHHLVHQVIVDWHNLDKVAGELNANDVYCCLGTTIKQAGTREKFKEVDYGYAIELAKITLANGCEQFLLISAMGANAHSGIFYNRVKGETENTLTKMGFPSLAIIRPSLLLGNRKEFRLGEKIGQVVMKIIGFSMIGPIRKYKAIHASTVAKAMAKAAHEKLSGVRILENDVLFDLAK